jgi:glutamate racemase
MNAGIASRRSLFLGMKSAPIGVFDSGYGGLTILKEIVRQLPGFDYVYLGDNARAPYGNRSFETVYRYTLQCVEWFFEQGCPLVVLACNTASAKALRTIQQNDLPKIDATRRVLGVIRPTTELIGNYSVTRRVGIMATAGTVQSASYILEIARFFPDITVLQQSCPMWVPLVENNEESEAGADYFIKKYLQQLLAQDAGIDTILLACTHYPLLVPKIEQFLPAGIRLLSQGDIVAKSLVNYLQRHPEIAAGISKTGGRQFFTTDDAMEFEQKAGVFYGEPIVASRIEL